MYLSSDFSYILEAIVRRNRQICSQLFDKLPPKTPLVESFLNEVAASQPDKARNFTEKGLHRGCLPENIGEIPLQLLCKQPRTVVFEKHSSGGVSKSFAKLTRKKPVPESTF